ncbi:hypothetical protein KBB27_03005 [Patescibacteria group bacterium]|nr:hypothetical protein [Patescibacteria group bacterium]
MNEVSPKVEFDRPYLRSLNRYVGLRQDMTRGAPDQMREDLRLREISRVGGLVGTDRPPVLRNLLSLLADVGVYAAGNYENELMQKLLPEDQKTREQLIPLAVDLFLTTCEKIGWRPLGSPLTVLNKGIARLCEGRKILLGERCFSREEQGVCDLAMDLGTYANNLAQETMQGTDRLSTQRSQEMIRLLRPLSLEAVGLFPLFQQLNEEGRISDEVFARYQDACLKFAEGAFLLLKGTEAYEKEQKQKANAATSRPASSSWASGEAVNRAAAAWEGRRPEEQVFVQGQAADFDQKIFGRPPLDKLMNARS